MLKKFGISLVALSFIGLLALYFWPEKSYSAYAVNAEYQKQVDAYFVPEMPPDWTWKTYETADGTRLRWGESGNRNAAKASIIWVPGYTATLDMYGEHFDLLARRGFHLIGLDLRGQGGSQRHRDNFPEKLWVEDFGVYAADIAEWMAELDLPSDRKVLLSGSSFGGHVVTRAAGEYDLSIAGLYLIAPAFKPASAPYSFDEAKRLMSVSRAFGKSENYVFGQKDWEPDGLDFTKGSTCSSYPKRLYLRDVIFTRQPEQRVGGVTNQWGAEFFESSEHINNEAFLSKLDMPVTIISASFDDFVITSENSKACANYIDDCREVLIPETGHCLPQENDAVIGQMMDEFDLLLKRAQR